MFTGDNTEAAPTARFTGTIEGAPMYAYYPYSETNSASPYTAVAGELPGLQVYSSADGDLSYDWKVGVPKDGAADEFSFTHLFSLLCFDINADGTGLSGERLERVVISAADDGAAMFRSGSFTVDLSTKAVTWGTYAAVNELTMEWTDKPTLTAGTTMHGYLTCSQAPGVTIKDRKIKVTVVTDVREASFTATLRTDFEAGVAYTFPLQLAEWKNASDAGYEEVERPTITSFEFTAAANAGKILSREAYYDATAGKTTTREVTTQALTIDSREDRITGIIPYLYDFTLVPTLTVGEGCTVTYGDDNAEWTAGTAVDFSQPVTFTVSKAGASRAYTVSVNNTGLPVVVLDGKSLGSVEFLHTRIVPKTSEFAENQTITIFDKNNPDNNLAEKACGFRLRGNSTSNFPKKPLAIKLVEKSKILGMSSHKRWCLLAGWIDRSLIRNAVAFDVAHTVEAALPYDDVNKEGLLWNPSGKNVELVLDGVHVGNYYLCEQVKIAGKRLDIQDCYKDMLDAYTTNSETNPAPTIDNCGYLLEFDDNYDEVNKFITTKRNLPCQAKDEIGKDEIWNYVKTWVQDVEDLLTAGNYTAAYKKLDITSVIDYWFIQELTMNGEYRHPKSVYMYKDGEGKLCAGPVWDFDYQTFPNVANINSINESNRKSDVSFTMSTLLYTKWSLVNNPGNAVSESDAPYMWYPLLFNDPTFKAKVKERWAVAYPALSAVTATIDELGAANSVSDKYNQAMWPIESKERTGYSWYIDYSGDERLSTYDEVIRNMKEVYLERLDKMNSAINGL